MFLNIITPCNKPENLHIISQSIGIPRDRYRWIVVFDLECMPDNLPENGEYYIARNAHPIPNTNSKGDYQRNFALDLISHGHVYFNDDDSTLHSELWENINTLSNYDFISFCQSWNNGRIRLKGDRIEIGEIDTHNFICDSKLIGEVRWRLDIYESDGHFAKEVYRKSSNPIWLPKFLSVYNSLDKTRFVTDLQDIEFYMNENNVPVVVTEIESLLDICRKDDFILNRCSYYEPHWPVIIGLCTDGQYKIIYGHEIIMRANLLALKQVNARFLDLQNAPEKFKILFD